MLSKTLNILKNILWTWCTFIPNLSIVLLIFKIFILMRLDMRSKYFSLGKLNLFKYFKYRILECISQSRNYYFLKYFSKQRISGKCFSTLRNIITNRENITEFHLFIKTSISLFLI